MTPPAPPLTESGVDESMCISRDAGVIEQVQAAAAAVGRPVAVVNEPDLVRQRWRRAGVVFVGADAAAMVVDLGLPGRRGLHLVGEDAGELVPWSARLDASVLVLPEATSRVSSLVTEQGRGTAGQARLVRVVGGSGGLGTSTLAAGLALAGARLGHRSALVDLDPLGGGLDLMLGAEHEPGWRWRDLTSASGHLGELSGRLPSAAGVDVVSHSGADGLTIRHEAVGAVVEALMRSHALVVLDAANGGDTTGEAWAACQSVLVVGADVRSVLAARRLAAHRGCVDAEVVVRTGPGRRLSSEEVARAVGLPLAGRIPEDRRLPSAMEVGEPPGRVRRRAWSRACSGLVQRWLPEPASGADPRAVATA